jgi:UDP:flavonoid glycosyltransferase YjiC (YdhE family)
MSVSTKRFVFTTFGTYGDIHPYMAIALELQKQGADVVIASSEYYREKVEKQGIPFAAVAPDVPSLEERNALMTAAMDPRRGPETVICKFMMPALRQTFDDLMNLTRPGDLLISHPITFATPLVAEKRQLPWVSSVLQPTGFFSAYDPPVLAPAPWLIHLRILGPRFYQGMFKLMEATIRSWAKPWHQLRSEVGLPPTTRNPIGAGQHSPNLVLALFSRHLAAPQIDWPANTQVTGFPFFDSDGEPELPDELEHFLNAGAPPIVFTLGTSAVNVAGDFYRESQRAVARLGCRAVYLLGKDTKQDIGPLTQYERATDYAPFSKLFPRAAVIVHQGGAGTTGQAMLAGRPMLVVPHAHDQPDHARRITRLGIGSQINPRRYRAETVATAIRDLLYQPRISQQAKRLGEQVALENGAHAAAIALMRH